MTNAPESEIRIISWPQRLLNRLPLPHGLAWIMIWQLIYVTDYLLNWRISGVDTATGSGVFAGLCLFFSCLCAALIYCTRVLERLYPQFVPVVSIDSSEFREWFQSRMHASYRGLLPLISGGLVSAAALYTLYDYIIQFTPPDQTLITLRVAYTAAGFFLCGIALWALITLTVLPVGMTRLGIRVSVNHYGDVGLRALGGAYLRMSLAISVCFMAAVSTAVLAPLENNPVVLAWLGLAALLIFGFFLLPQVGIHRVMAQEKSLRLAGFSQHLDQAMEKTLRDPSPENMNRLRELFEVHNHLKAMNEWPFDLSSVWQLLTALIIPILLALAEWLFKD